MQFNVAVLNAGAFFQQRMTVANDIELPCIFALRLISVVLNKRAGSLLYLRTHDRTDIHLPEGIIEGIVSITHGFIASISSASDNEVDQVTWNLGVAYSCLLWAVSYTHLTLPTILLV